MSEICIVKEKKSLCMSKKSVSVLCMCVCLIYICNKIHPVYSFGNIVRIKSKGRLKRKKNLTCFFKNEVILIIGIYKNSLTFTTNYNGT